MYETTIRDVVKDAIKGMMRDDDIDDAEYIGAIADEIFSVLGICEEDQDRFINEIEIIIDSKYDK